MNVLRKISIDTVLLWLAVALCIAGLVWLGGAHAWITALGVGVFVAAQEAPHATNPPRSCATCSRPLNAWQLRFDGGAELRCGRYDCAAKDKLVATRDADGTVREMVTASASDASPPELPAGSTLIGLDDNAGIFGATTVDVPALYDQIERQAAEIERLKREFNRAESAYMGDVREAKRERDKARCDENLRANDVFRGIVAENDRLKSRVAELTESVDLLDSEGRRMKTERDEARAELTHYVTLLRESAPDIDKALEGSKPPDLKDHNAWTIYAFIAALTGLRKMEEARTQERDAAQAEIERLKESLATACATGEPPTAEQHAELLDALAQIKALNSEIERMKPVVDLVGEWCQVADGTPEEDAIETRIIDAFGEYQEAGAL